MRLNYARLLLITSSILGLVLADLDCRPEGPVLPKPTLIQESKTFQDASLKLRNKLDDIVSGDLTAGWSIENSSFSLAVISVDQQDAGTPIWEYHHLGSANVEGTKNVDRDTQYLIGSISKVVTAYVLLKSGIDVDAPITEFLPTLSTSDTNIQWRNITLRMVASHLSGVPTNYGSSEYYFLRDVYLAVGLPPIEDSDYPKCNVAGLNKACSAQELLNAILKEDPITAPGERPAYSNLAYNLMGLALENYTGKKYTQLVQEIFSEPLCLTNTFPSPGDDEKAVIPSIANSWGADYSINTPAGGLVSTISDLSKFSHALLSRSLDLTPTETNQWLKPGSFAGSSHSSVGMPWELFRSSNFTPDHPHTVTTYGKSGGAQGYRSQIDIIDEYGIAIVILTAGPMNAAPILRDAMLATFLPAVDAVSREQAEAYEGDFFSNSSDLPINATIRQEEDSLLLSALYRNDTDILEGLIKIWTATMGEFLAPGGSTIRLLPTQLREETTLNGEAVFQEVWHLWPEIIPGAKSDLPTTGVMDQECMTWTIGDWVHYGGESLDRVLFYRNKDGGVVGFEVPFLRSGVLLPSLMMEDFRYL